MKGPSFNNMFLTVVVPALLCTAQQHGLAHALGDDAQMQEQGNHCPLNDFLRLLVENMRSNELPPLLSPPAIPSLPTPSRFDKLGPNSSRHNPVINQNESLAHTLNAAGIGRGGATDYSYQLFVNAIWYETQSSIGELMQQTTGENRVYNPNPIPETEKDNPLVKIPPVVGPEKIMPGNIQGRITGKIPQLRGGFYMLGGRSSRESTKFNGNHNSNKTKKSRNGSRKGSGRRGHSKQVN